MKIEAVIFDWAGTTVDYGCFAPVQAFVEVFKAYGMEPTMEETRKPMGMLKWDHIKTMLEMERIGNQFKAAHHRAFTDADVDAMHEMFASKLLGILDQFAAPKPYVTEVVQALREKGIRIGSTTGYTDQMMEIVTREAAKAGYAPDCWFSPDATGKMGRPYPFMIFKNLEALRVSSVSAAIKVGDTISDIKEGKNAGLFTVGIVEGSSEMGLTEAEFEALDREEKESRIQEVTRRYLEAGADYVAMDIRDVLQLVEEDC